MSSSDSAGNPHPDMAETIALAGAASMELQPTGSSGAADHFDDEEYPFAPGAVNGVKCCTKCGATKTPQWREGPFGPKTLCNACGVKRTRKLRAEQEGAKRRKLSASPAPPAQLKHAAAASYPAAGPKYSPKGQYAQEAPAALALDSYGSLEDFEAAFFPVPPTAGAGTAARRPARRAAEEAAVRTARYARTGEWAEGQEGVLEEALRAATPSSSSDYSLPSSNCPEEVSWPPLAGADAAACVAGTDCFAAINLMTMSAKQTAHALAAVNAVNSGAATATAAAATSSGGATFSATASPTVFSMGGTLLDPEQINHDSLLAMAARYDGCGGASGVACHMAPHKVAPVDLQELSQCLPPNKVLELVRLNQELEMAVHEAHAANAAVAAVAQVLASKQAAALRAREVAGNATKRLRRFMAELDTQFGIQSKFGSGSSGSSRRPPLSPSKAPAAAMAAAAAALGSPTLAPAAPLSPAPPLLAPRLPAAPSLEPCPL